MTSSAVERHNSLADFGKGTLLCAVYAAEVMLTNLESALDTLIIVDPLLL
jgi:hypothetical protein